MVISNICVTYKGNQRFIKMLYSWNWELTFKALEGFKKLSKRLCGELFMVLRSHLNADLQVLSDISRQHGSKALQGVFHRQRAKKVHQPLEVTRTYRCKP